MTSTDLTYIGSDPGAVKYGNFINYYTFHSAKERINHLNLKMFPVSEDSQPILCLDIGCNTGELSNEIHSYLKRTIYKKHDIKILAIDIDPTLIQRAQESYTGSDITFKACNIMMHSDNNTITEYLDSYKKQSFDLTFCFSVTMWIHLNNGDKGLEEFIEHITNISKTIIIEPQPWNCYRNAQRRVKKSGSSFPLYEKLKIRSNVDVKIENLLQRSHNKTYESPASSWNRKVQSYQLPPT